ncbi:transposase [Streptomyces sp. NBC_01408]|uniref:transposase n=1 Tax=Streptomyces sp. NBC_01408 TaxID=2903855 RepID=UPI002253DD18|nr:transposase [Streptomyces sp. NBC_01408]MCX4693890.1 transposase [Streptomyces sp. NBC_01408]
MNSLAQRERAKADELTAAGHAMSASGIKQRRQRYQRDGLVGLADGRSAKRMPAFGRVAPAVTEAMQQAIAETAEASSKTIGFVVWRATQILAAREDAADIEVPSQRMLYRLFDKMAIGTHATGSATARRSSAARPAGPLGEVPACAPGEWMQIDSTPLDILVRLDEGIAEKVELTGMVDLATRSLPAAVLRPTTKAADASALLARSVTPELMCPGWSEALRMSRSALPHRRLLGLDERLEHAAARPVIVPDTLSNPKLIRACAGLDGSAPGTAGAAAHTLKLLARRIQHLTDEIEDLTTRIRDVITQHNPQLLGCYGVGPDTAATLLIAAGDNPERLRSEASFAALCGVSPVEASSGKTQRRRLNRGGNRQANSALYTVVLARLRWDTRTRTYVDRRVSEGKTRREALRCLKRYVAREIHRLITFASADPHTHLLAA